MSSSSSSSGSRTAGRLRAGFAYNDWQQHVGPGAILNPNNLAGGMNASGAVVDVANNINSTWQFNVSGMVQLPLGIEASANFYGRQGYPILYGVQVITHDPVPNLFENPFIQIGPVGAYRLPDCLPARSPSREGLPDRIDGHAQPHARLFQRGEQPHRAASETGSSGRTMPKHPGIFACDE